MRKLWLLLAAFFVVCANASATVYYVRTDGGTATQCTGTSNAAYPGSGTGQACAVNHLYWLLNQTTGAWLIAANDTVQFEDLGPYYVGASNGTVGYNWTFSGCPGSDCHPPALPDGVKIYGKNVGACTAQSARTKLVGINHLFELFILQGTNGDDLECLDISQLATCTGQMKTSYTVTNTSLSGNVATITWNYPGYDNVVAVGEPVTIAGTTNGGGAFNVTNAIVTALNVTSGSPGNGSPATGTFTVNLTHANVASAADSGTIDFSGYCDAHAGQSGDYLGTGIMLSYLAGSQGPRNATIKDVAIHGLKNDAIHGGKLNTLTSDVVTLYDVQLDGNGGEGFNYDSGGCGTNCESIGTINITNSEANWNGCVEVHPNGGTIGGNGYNYCVDQAYNGNGDGWVMLATGGTWNWTNDKAEYNAQDGFDSLHVGDDSAVQPTVNMAQLYAVGNEGQSIKGGGGNMTLTNSIGIANCNVFQNASNFPGNPAGWNALAGQRCRANDAMAFGMQGSNSLTIENVTNIGEQNVMWDISNASCTTGCKVVFKNNTTLGYTQPVYSGYPGGLYWASTFDPFSTTGSVAANNAWYHTGGSGCPSDPTYETNFVCTDPKFSNEALNAANVQLLSGSPLIAAGVAVSGVTTDYAGIARPNPPSIGAYELGGSPPLAPTQLSGTLFLNGVLVIQ